MAENKKFSVRTDGTGQNVFVSDVFLLSVPEEDRPKALSINDDGRVVLTTVSGSGGGGTVDTGSLLNNASVSLNTITFTKGDTSTFDITVDTGSAAAVNTGSLLQTASVSLNTITFTKGDTSTFDITVDTGSDTVTSYTNASNNRIITSTGAGGINGEANLTFNGSTLGVIGTVGVGTNNPTYQLHVSSSTAALGVYERAGGAALYLEGQLTRGVLGTVGVHPLIIAYNSGEVARFTGTSFLITGSLDVSSGITANLGTGTDNSVVVKNSSNQLVTDEIDPKVWAGNLVDKQGTPVQYQVATFNDSDTLIGSSNFTFNDSTLLITGNVTATSFTGSLSGSATTATNATSASYAATASLLEGTIDSASFAETASYVEYANIANKPSLISSSAQLDGFISKSANFTTNELIVADGINSVVSSNILSLDTVNNYVGINQSNPEVTLHMTGEGAQTAQIRMEQYNDSADAPDLRTRRYRGTIALSSSIEAGDYLYRSNHEYWNGSALIVGGAFAFDNTNDANRTQFAVSVTTDGTSADPANASKVQFKIDGNDGGAITFNNAYKFPTSDGTNGQSLITNGSGVLSFGTVSTSSFALTSDSASKITIDPVTSTDTTAYPVLVGNNSVGAQSPFIDNTNLSYNASTNTLTTTTFSGALSGNATTATTASYANKLNPSAWYKEVGTTITNNKDTTNTSPGFLYPMDSSTGTITFTLNAGGASLSGGEEWDFFVLDLTNQIDFAVAGGESVISENGLKANSTGSAITAKFLGNIGGTNTWALVGSLQP